MPTSPAGGLSIFINLAILLVGFVIKMIKRIGFKVFAVSFIYLILTDKRYDSVLRRTLGYTLAFSLFFVVSVSTSVSIYKRLTNESNFDYLAPKMSEAINTISSGFKKPEKMQTDLPQQEKELENKIIDLSNLAFLRASEQN